MSTKTIPSDELRAIVEQANRQAPGTRRSQTAQTREAIAAMKALGVPRKEYKAQTLYEYEGRSRIYGPAHVSPRTDEATRTIIENADLLASVGFRVFITRSDARTSAWMFTGCEGSVTTFDSRQDAE